MGRDLCRAKWQEWEFLAIPSGYHIATSEALGLGDGKKQQYILHVQPTAGNAWHGSECGVLNPKDSYCLGGNIELAYC